MTAGDGPIGDEERALWLEALYHRHNRPIYAYLRAVGISKEDSQDLVQETFAAAFKGLDRFEGRAEIGTWLIGIAKKLHQEKQRHRGRQKRNAIEVSLDSLDADRQAWLAARTRGGGLTSSRPTLDQALTVEELQLVRDEMGQLSPRMRECLTLRVHGQSYKEIANQLDITDATARWNVSKARERLKVRVDGHHARHLLEKPP